MVMTRLTPASHRRHLLAALVLASLGCHTATQFAVQHTSGPILGPCAAAMDSVTEDRGKPLKKVVGDEEDISSGEQAFEHEWGYPLDPPVPDSLLVVRFRWTEHYKSCRVDERRAKQLRGALLPPWNEDPAS
jgi:hypothetical protein